jgi:hypothetical protein
VLHLSSTGVVLGQAGSHGQAEGQFDGPRSVAVDGADNMYVADSGNHRIQKLAPDGKVLAVWGSFGTGPANLNFPFGVALDSQGNVYVADRNNNRVVRLSSQGAPLAAWPTASNTDSPLTNPSSVLWTPRAISTWRVGRAIAFSGLRNSHPVARRSQPGRSTARTRLSSRCLTSLP